MFSVNESISPGIDRCERVAKKHDGISSRSMAGWSFPLKLTVNWPAVGPIQTKDPRTREKRGHDEHR